MLPVSWRTPLTSAAVDRALLQQAPQPVGQLDLAGPILFLRGLLERREDVGREDVAADDREVRRRLLARRLLDEVADAVDARADLLGVDDAVRARRSRAGPLRSPGPGRRTSSNTSIIWRSAGGSASITSSARMTAKGSSPTSSARDQHRVAEAERFPLAHVRHVDQVRDLADLVELIASCRATRGRSRARRRRRNDPRSRSCRGR